MTNKFIELKPYNSIETVWIKINSIVGIIIDKDISFTIKTKFDETYILDYKRHFWAIKEIINF